MKVPSFSKIGTLGALALAVPLLAGAPGGAALAATVQIGGLNCTVEGGVGFIIGSSKDMVCTFTHANGQRERYGGTIRKFGLDIGVTEKTYIAWAVFAPSQDVPRGALAGSYAGVTAEATVGAGIGANALVGGLRKSFTLQPLSVQAQSGGLNVAAGIASLELRAR